MLAPNFHRRAELEPLESWLSIHLLLFYFLYYIFTLNQKKGMLPRYPGAQKQNRVNQQKAQNMPDFHVLLSLIYPQDDEPAAPLIAGGLAFEYHFIMKKETKEKGKEGNAINANNSNRKIKRRIDKK